MDEVMKNQINISLSNIFSRLLNSQFLQYVSLTFLMRLSVMIFSLSLSILLARYLGPDGKGILAVLNVLMGIVSQFGYLGLHASNTYFVARDKSRKEDVAIISLWVSFLLGTLLPSVTLLFLYMKGSILRDIPFLFILITLFSAPFEMFFYLGQNIFLGLYEIKKFNALEFAKGLFTFLSIASLLVLFNKGVREIVLNNFIISFIFASLVYLKLLGWKASVLTFNFPLFKDMFRYGLKSYIACLISFLTMKFDLLLVNHFLGAGPSGLYSTATRLGEMMLVVPVTVGTVLFPKISGMGEGRWDFAKKNLFFVGSLMIILCGGMAIFSRSIILFLYGKSFEGATIPFLFILPGIFFLSFHNIYMNYFAGTGMPPVVIISPLIGLIISLPLNFLLIPSIGIKGASITFSLSSLVMLLSSMVYNYFYIKKEL